VLIQAARQKSRTKRNTRRLRAIPINGFLPQPQSLRSIPGTPEAHFLQRCFLIVIFIFPRCRSDREIQESLSILLLIYCIAASNDFQTPIEQVGVLHPLTDVTRQIEHVTEGAPVMAEASNRYRLPVAGGRCVGISVNPIIP